MARTIASPSPPSVGTLESWLALKSHRRPYIPKLQTPKRTIMLSLLLPLALLSPLLPTLTTAQCPACDSYQSALKTCQTPSANTLAAGSSMDVAGIQCMCTKESSAQELNTCQGCNNADLNLEIDVGALLAWTTTCQADGKFGDEQAVKCWMGQPSDPLPCFMKGSGSGSGGGSLTGTGR